MTFKWLQTGNNLLLESPHGTYHFVMPKDWKNEDTHPDLFKLVEFILFNPWYKSEFCKTAIEKYPWSRKQGKKIGHCFSTGMDSTAAMLLLPEDTELIYHQRINCEFGQYNQENALYMISQMKRKVHIVQSDHERIKTSFPGCPVSYGVKRGGFSTDFACGAGAILLADYLDLGYFSTGTILGSTYIEKGGKYRDFINSEYWNYWEPLFKQAGLQLIFPTACCSEVVTNKIVNQSEYKELVQSCNRGGIGKPCNKCFKCFRKNLLNGKLSEISDEVKRNLIQRPLHQGDALVYAYQKSGFSISDLEGYKTIDVKWLERYYPKALKEMVPLEISNEIEENLKKYNIEPMNEEDTNKLKSFDITKERFFYYQDFFNKYNYKVYSQSGEDGIVDELFKRLGIDSGWVVEFGAWNGKAFSNTFEKVRTGKFKAVYIESDPIRYKALTETALMYPNIIPINKYIEYTEDAENLLQNVLKITPIPKEFELCSIDTDSYDYQIWDSFKGYNPKIVIIESSPYAPGEYIFNPQVYWDNKMIPIPPEVPKEKYGSSFLSILKLGKRKGYTYIGPCIDDGGPNFRNQSGNMFFVRTDLIKQLGDIKIPQ